MTIHNSRLKFDLDEIANEMLDRVDQSLFESGDTTFLDPAMAGGQMLKALEDRLRQFGHSDENISKRVFGVSENPLHSGFARKKNNLVGHIFEQGELDDGMKFDLGLANPPFSLGKKLLYPEFFDNCLENCGTVAMVMPYDMVSRQSRLRKYQETVTRHSSYVSEDISEHFKGISVGRISYVVASKGVKNPVPDFSNDNPFDSVPLLYPERKRMKSIKSIGGPALLGPTLTDKVDVLWKIFRGDEQEVVTKDAKEFEKKKVKTRAPWVVVTNHCPSQGKFNTAVVKCDGSTVLGNWVFAVEVASKSDGKKLAEWLKSPEMVQHISDLLEANNGTYGASKALFARLPWFE